MTFPNHDARMPVQQMPPEGLFDPTRKAVAAQENFPAQEKVCTFYNTLDDRGRRPDALPDAT
jgi:hypothetical protein